MHRYGIVFVLLTSILAICLTGFACSQSTPNSEEPAPTEAWIVRYDNGIHDDDGAWAMVIDSAENIYVTGYSWGNGTGADYATVKYDTAGNQLWVDRYNGPGNGEDWAWDIALDSAGNLYVTGWSTGNGTQEDCATIRYDSDGNRLWVARYNSPANGHDMAYALALDGLGNIYISGWSQGTGSNADYITLKYDSNGTQLWAARYNGPANSEDKASDLAVDKTGNVYVTGWSTGNGTGTDCTTIKYDTQGNMLWVARYNGPANSGDMATAITLDSSGNIYVTGSSTGKDTDTDYATIKYDSRGKQLWVARYNGPANGKDGASAIALDNSGNIYITGNSLGNGTGADYATIKYSKDGKQVWLSRYDGPAKSEDSSRAIALDSADNIYVTGWSTGSDTSSFDYATVKYNNKGKQLWVARYDGPASRPDKAYALATANSGALYVTGRSSGKGTYYDFATIKYIQHVVGAAGSETP